MIRRLLGKWLVNRHMKETGHPVTSAPDLFGHTGRVHIYCLGCGEEWVI